MPTQQWIFLCAKMASELWIVSIIIIFIFLVPITGTVDVRSF